LFKGEYDRVFALKEDVLRMMAERFNLLVYVRMLIATSFALSYLGRWDEAVEEGQNALNVAQEFSDNAHISLAALTISAAYTLKGNMGRAVEYRKMSVKKAPTPAHEAWSQTFLAWAWCRAGEPKKGIEALDPLVQIFRAGRYVFSEIIVVPCLGEGYWLAGEYDKARQTLEQGVEITERCGAKYYIALNQRLLGEVAMETNLAEAELHFEKSIAIFLEIKAENELALAYAGYGRFHKQQGNVTQAREYLTKALEIFERLGTLMEPDKVREELASLSPDKE
jgi:tetratricopeptide (TPR) repeat protein